MESLTENLYMLKLEKIIESLEELSYEDLSKETVIAKLLGYGNFDNYDEVAVYTKGYRILNKIPRMPSNIVENLVDSFKSFQHILAADIESLDEVDGIGEVRARTIKQSLMMPKILSHLPLKLILSHLLNAKKTGLLLMISHQMNMKV